MPLKPVRFYAHFVIPSFGIWRQCNVILPFFEAFLIDVYESGADTYKQGKDQKRRRNVNVVATLQRHWYRLK